MEYAAPTKISGIRFTDDRGVLKAWHFPADFTAKRFYTVSNWKQGFVRAWHGHMFEEKLVFVTKGAGLIACTRLDDLVAPDKKQNVNKFILDASATDGILIPKGFANGLKSLTEDCEFLIFSNKTVEESKNDDYRFPVDYWDVWSVDER